MSKCNPDRMSKNLEAVQEFRKAGYDFICIPVKSESHRAELISQQERTFKKIIEDAEK